MVALFCLLFSLMNYLAEVNDQVYGSSRLGLCGIDYIHCCNPISLCMLIKYEQGYVDKLMIIHR